MNKVESFRYDVDGNIEGHDPSSPKGFHRNRSMDNCFPSIPSLSKSGSRRSNTPTRSCRLFKTMGRKGAADALSSSPPSMGQQSTPDSTPTRPFLTKSASGSTRRSAGTSIMFSSSSGKLKPPPVEKKLECTLEEMCFGCRKKIMLTRDVVTNTGQIIKEDELLTIKVKPGWKKGTEITFEGMGNERPGTYPADIVFVVVEKRHSLFRREGDDLELAVDIPLVKALAGCTLSIPLLGGESIPLTIGDIIHPGYVKIIDGQGMPNSKEPRKRGNLKITFRVFFPAQLTDEQRSDVLSILHDTC